MPWTVGGAAIMGGGSVASALIGSSSAKKAAKEQAAAQAAATALQQQQFNTTQQNMAPWLQSGESAVFKISDLLGLGLQPLTEEQIAQLPPKPDVEKIWQEHEAAHIAQFGVPIPGGRNNSTTAQQVQNAYKAQLDEWEDKAEQMQLAQGGGVDPESSPLLRRFTMADFMADPVTQAGFQSGLDEGSKAINNIFGARGMRNSGATIKALTRFGTDYANQKAGESYNRFVGDQSSIYNKLAGVAGTGQVAANNVSTAGANTAGNIGNLLTGGANARGAASIAGGNAWNNAFNTIGGWWNQQNMMNKFFPQPQSGGEAYA